jgi:hypothetical protein
MVRCPSRRSICGMDLCDSACNSNLSKYNSIMEKELIQEIDRIVWDDVSDDAKVNSLQKLMYQWGACMDNKTEEMFGDDDAHIHSPNFRRI